MNTELRSQSSEGAGLGRRLERSVLCALAVVALAIAVAVTVASPPDFLLPGPDTTRAPRTKSWPSAEQLGALHAIEGNSRKRVVRILGHPAHIETTADAAEVWTYPWLAAAKVYFKGGVATGSFYTAGY